MMKRVLSIVAAILFNLILIIAVFQFPVFAAVEWAENWDSYGSPSVRWSENWDLYSTGQSMHGVNSWKGWDNNSSATAFTTNAQYVSSPNSIAITAGSDLVHEFSNYGNNIWIFTTKQFVPSDFNGSTYFILLGDYADGGPYFWITQVHFDSASNQVVDDIYGGTLPLIKNQWVEIRVEIDIAADLQKLYYGGNLLFQGDAAAVLGYDIQTVDAIDLFANGASPVYYDDLSISTSGQSMHGVNGWKGWDNNSSATAFTTNAQYVSSPNSIAITAGSDLVHEFSNYGNNIWIFTTKQFVPSDFNGSTYFILLGDYADGGPYFWITQVHFDSASNQVVDDIYGGTLPLIKNQWVEIRVEIDIAADLQKLYYGGNLLFQGDAAAVLGYDIQTVDAIDLFANGASPVYYDDMSISDANNGGPGPTPGPEVGGEVYPINKFMMLIPVIIVGVALLSGIVVLKWRNIIVK